jgi:hypothetical protein
MRGGAVGEQDSQHDAQPRCARQAPHSGAKSSQRNDAHAIAPCVSMLMCVAAMRWLATKPTLKIVFA